jgi:hypothetical protein
METSPGVVEMPGFPDHPGLVDWRYYANVI